MVITNHVLDVAAIVCFLLAACPPIFKVTIRWEMLAFALLVCTLL